MKLVIRPDAESTARTAAHLVAQAIAGRGGAGVLGFATGRTMERIYRALVGRHEAGTLDFAAVRSFNLDEYVGLPTADPRSYHSYMRQHLFGRVNLASDHVHVPDGMAADLAAESRRYEAAISAAGGIDLQVLGLGETGHIGFNEPLSSFASRTRAVTLTPRTRRQNAAMFGGELDRVPPRAITMGVATILEARRLLLIVTGAAKAEILARAVEGPLTASVPATALHLHPDVLVLADEAAASALSHRDAYASIARHDPEIAELPA